MVTNQACWVVVAAFNEAETIGQVVREIIRADYSVVVVDDGSQDETGQCALDAGAIVLTHCVNLGQGAALQTGITFALLRGAETIVTFDADGQHQIKDVERLRRKLQDQAFDIVFGSRFLGTQAIGMSRSRRVLLRAAVLFTRITTGLSMTDAHCGLRAMNRKCAETLCITQNGMAHATQIPTQVKHSGLRWVEEPVEVLYSEYSKSKGQRASGSIVIALDVLVGRNRK